MIIEFGLHGVHLRTRFIAASMREKISQVWEKEESLVFDFSKVEMISASFADECFGKLVEDLHILREDFYKKTDFRNTSPFIMSFIDKAFKERKVRQQLALA